MYAPGTLLRPTLLLTLILAICSVSAESPEPRVFAVAPEQAAYADSRPLFIIGYEAPDRLESRELRFRLTLTDDRRERVFDQRKRRKGWAHGEEGRMLYHPRRPLPDGEYRWKVELWNGVEWIGGGPARELTIDTVPPADVEGLEVRAIERGRIELAWVPVSLDRDGRPEFVARYHVYRYEKRGSFPTLEMFEIGVSETAAFLDIRAPTDGSSIVYYRVTAEDLAGNEPGKR